MMNTTERKKTALFLLAVLLVVLLLQVYFWPHVADDAYISFRYAWNLSHGQGLVFNVGERVEGFSNPLWTLLLAASNKLTGLEIPNIARGAGLLCTFFILVVLWWASGSRFPNQPPHVLGYAFLLLLLTPGFHYYATAGLEGPLFSLLIIVGVLLSLESSRRARLLASVCFGLVSITRPEGALYAMLWFLATIPSWKSLSRVLKEEFLPALIVITPFAAWQVFRLSYYGAWLPNTAIAKPPGLFPDLTDTVSYLTPWALAFGGVVFLILLFVLKLKSDRTLLERQVLAVVIACLTFVVYTEGDWMTFGRFVVPVVPLVALAVGMRLVELLDMLSEHVMPVLRRGIYIVAAIGFLASAVFAWRPSVLEYIRNDMYTPVMRAESLVDAGRWLDERIRPSATVAAVRLGGMSYAMNRFVVWDLLGLTDAEQARWVRDGRPGGPAESPVMKRHPDVVILPDLPPQVGMPPNAVMYDMHRKGYVSIKRFTQGIFGMVEVWVKRERMRDLILDASDFPIPPDIQ